MRVKIGNPKHERERSVPQSNEYPKKIVTTEKTSEASEEIQVVTVVGNEYEEKAVGVAIAYMNAFNEEDVHRCNASINFPHVRLGVGDNLVVSENAEALMPTNFFTEFRKRTQWNHSGWDYREVIQSIENKIHIKVMFSRYGAYGSKIGMYPSIWVITKQDNHWGIKMRSSFA